MSLPLRHNELDGVSNHRRPDRLLKRLFRCRLKKTSKPPVAGLCEGNDRWIPPPPPPPTPPPQKKASSADMLSFDDVIVCPRLTSPMLEHLYHCLHARKASWEIWLNNHINPVKSIKKRTGYSKPWISLWGDIQFSLGLAMQQESHIFFLHNIIPLVRLKKFLRGLFVNRVYRHITTHRLPMATRN